MLKRNWKLIILPMIMICLLAIFGNTDKQFVAASSGTTGACTWTLEDGVLTISGEGAMGDYGEKSPWQNATVNEVIIEEGVTKIGIRAFRRCADITSVTVPSTVTEIGSWAFYDCTSLGGIDISGNVEIINEGAFSGCSALKSVSFSKELTNIGKDAFCGCKRLKNVELPEGIKSIGDSAFEGCTALESINLPESIEELGSFLFEGDSALQSVKIPEGITLIWGTFSGCSGLTSVILPESLEQIGNYSFLGCSSLESIEIPKNVVEINLSAFNGCSKLKSIEIPEGVKEIPNYAFRYCSSLTDVTFLGDVTYIGTYAFSECNALESFEVPESVVTIDEYAFFNCAELKKVSIPGSVRTIKKSAFNTCKKLTDVEIEYGVETFGEFVFGGCSELTEIVIPDSVETIGRGLLYQCNKMEKVTLPCLGQSNENNTYLSFTFGNASVDTISGLVPETLTTVVLSEACTNIGYRAFSLQSQITNIEILGDVTSIGSEAFKECTGLTEIALPDSVTILSGSTFLDCTNLVSVKMPSGLTSCGSNIFKGCSSLESIELPVGVHIVCGSMFQGCTNLKNVTLAPVTYRITTSAFANCTSLETIEVPETLESIWSSAFSGCSALKSIDLPEGMLRIEGYAFANCSSLEAVIIRSKTVEIYENAFNNSENVVIYGYKNSTAEEFANKYSIPFVSIDEKPTAVSLDITEKSIELPGTFQLSVTVEPAECALPPVWSSSNEAVATVTQDGYVTAVGEGTAIITVTVGDLTATCTVVVTLSPEDAWEQVVEEAVSAIEEAQAGDSVEIDMKLGEDVASTVPEEVLEAARGKDVEVVLDFGDYKWSVNGENITAEEVGDVSLEVELDSNAINESLVGEVAGNDDSIQISLVHDGDFGFRASLTLNVGTENAGQYGTLYYYNGEGELEYVSSELIDEDGNVVFTFSHASDYVIVIGEERDAEEEIENPFKDVQEGQYYYKPVLWAVENSITAGLSATEFGPNETCTRAQIVTFLWRAAGRPEVTTAINPFTDVPSDAYYTKAVLWAVEKGITAGLSATEFGPGETCTRAQIVAFLWRAFGKQEPTTTTNPFTDVPANAYYAKAVLWAVENNITAGLSSTKFGPEAACTRGQVVSFLYRAYAK